MTTGLKLGGESPVSSAASACTRMPGGGSMRWSWVGEKRKQVVAQMSQIFTVSTEI